MDPRVTFFKTAFDHQTGNGFDFPVFNGSHQIGQGFNFPVYQGRAQYGQGFGDVLRGIWRFFRFVAIKGAQTLLKAGSEAIKDGATVKEVLSSTLKPTIGAVLGATAEQVANHMTKNKPTAAPPPGPPTSLPEAVLVGTQGATTPQNGAGKRRRSPIYKSYYNQQKHSSRHRAKRPIIYNF